MAEGGVVFRVDGSRTLGLGHIVRSLNLAKALQIELVERSAAIPITFVTLDDPSTRGIFQNSGFAGAVVWLQDESDQFRELHTVLKGLSPRVVISDIDLTGRIDEYEKLLHPRSMHVSLHEHNYPILSGDIVIAPSVRPLETGPGGTPGVTHFLGADYVLLSPDIKLLREKSQPPSNVPGEGMISLGGGDPSRLTLKMLTALRADDRRQITWKVVLGPASGYDPTGLAADYSGPFQFIPGAELGREGFLDLLSKCDMVITNGGTTLYEALALGRPAFAVPQNDFESEVIGRLCDEGACRGLSDNGFQTFSSDLDRFLHSSDDRLLTGRTGSEMIDGDGCRRVARLIAGRLLR